MKVFADNIKEQFGTILLPYIDKFAKFFTTTLGPAISKGVALIGPVLSKVAGIVGPVIDQIVKGFSALSGPGGPGGLASTLAPLGAVLSGVFGGIGAVIGGAGPLLIWSSKLPAVGDMLAQSPDVLCACPRPFVPGEKPPPSGVRLSTLDVDGEGITGGGRAWMRE